MPSEKAFDRIGPVLRRRETVNGKLGKFMFSFSDLRSQIKSKHPVPFTGHFMSATAFRLTNRQPI